MFTSPQESAVIRSEPKWTDIDQELDLAKSFGQLLYCHDPQSNKERLIVIQAPKSDYFGSRA